MARDAVKKLRDKNARVLQNLLYTIGGVSALYALLRFGVLYAGWTTWHTVQFLSFGGLYYFIYSQLKNAARCTYDEQAVLLTAGQDISEGWFEYYYDVVYVSAFIQICSLYSSRFFWLFLIIPVYALWAARGMFGMLSQFMPQRNAEEEQDAAGGKRGNRAQPRQRMVNVRR